jgi:hypothetical protein
VPDDETIMLLLVSPVDHKILPAQSLDVKVIVVPAHTILSASSEIIVGAGGTEFTTIVCKADAELSQLLTVQVAL